MTLIIKITIKHVRQALPFSLAIALLASSCTQGKRAPDGGPEDSGFTVTRAQMLSSTGDCVVSSARDFQAAAIALEQSLTGSPSPQTMTPAREAFHAAVDQWQISEVMQFGPAASSASLGGADLRDQIYSWPLVSRCAIEEALVAKSYESGLAAQLINRRGLYAIEYLLFYEGAATTCPSTSTIVATGSWAALSSTELQARRWQYASAAAAQVRLRADELVKRWDTDFLAVLKGGEQSGATPKSQQQLLNLVSDALFYVEHELKDLKLARPIGLRDCAVAPCLELLESQFGARSKANVKANFEGFRRVYAGCGNNPQAVGFDDLLRAVSADGLAKRMSDAIDGADAALAAIEEPDFGVALRDDPGSVRGLYDAVKKMTDLLKTEMMGVLDLEIPHSLEGDND